MKGLIEIAKEAIPMSAGVAVTGVSGAVLAAPSWLIAVGQAAIVVIFTVKAIDKRLARLHKAVNQLRGEVEVLEGRCIVHRKEVADGVALRDRDGRAV